MNVPEKHRAVARAWVDGAQLEVRDPKATCPVLSDWRICSHPAWHEDWEYRIKPTKPTKPSINWEHVAPEYGALATEKNGNSYIFMRIPEATMDEWGAVYPRKGAEAFQSFVKGTCDWKDSLVVRPSVDSEKVAEAAAPSPTTDAPTPKLEWSKTLANGMRVTFAEAEKVVAELGDGWRLPTRQELESILDLSCYDPCIDTTEFPDTKSDMYWTSSPCAWNKPACWAVSFYLGSIANLGIDGACVRAVRNRE